MTAAEPARTRQSLHAVAELLLAGPQYRASGTIRLRVAPGGFRTWVEPAVAVVGTDLVVEGTAHAINGRTARQLADAVGVDAGAPRGVYADGNGLGEDDELVLDEGTARQLTGALELGDAALRLFAPDEEPVLWPEHFDVAIRVDGVNYGVSPGDTFHAEPYAYVGPDTVPPGDPFWNAPFGVAVPVGGFDSAEALRDFFADARRRL